MNKHNQMPELEAFLEQHPDTRFMELMVTDMNGVLRGKRAGQDEFSKPFKNGVNFCASTVVMNTIGETFTSVKYGGRDGDPDAKARVVPGSLAAVPWASRPTAQALLELVDLKGQPLFFDPRTVLRRAMQPLYDLGLQARAGHRTGVLPGGTRRPELSPARTPGAGLRCANRRPPIRGNG